jgi:hypothetical protein
MRGILVAIVAIGWIACGGSDAGDTAGTAQPEKAPPVSSAPEAAKTPPTPELSTDPQAQRCLDLVRQSKFQEAVPVCLAALDVDPDNAQVKQALDQARTEAAKLAAAEAAAGSEAASELGEAAGGMKLGQ